MACRLPSRLAAFAAWLCLAGPVWSEAQDVGQDLPQYSVDTWTVKEGLPSGRVRAIAQTRDGYLWLLTTGGLVRFDGVRFSPSPELQRVLEKEIVSARAMLVAGDGALWLGGGGFLCRLKDGHGTVYRRSFDIASMAESAMGGGLWLGFEHLGLTRFEDGKFTELPSVDVVVTSLVEDRQHRLWVGTHGAGLHWLHGDALVRPAVRPPSEPYVNTIAEDRQGRLWIGGRAGVTLLGSEHRAASPVTRMLTASDVTSLYEDHEGAIWIGTAQGGVYRVKDGRLATLPPIARFAEDGVLSIYEDREGSVWIGMTDGLARLRRSRFIAYTTKEGLAHNNVASVLEARDGTVWTFSDGGGISAIRMGAVVRRITTREGLASNYGGPLFESTDGSIWAGTASGLCRIRGGLVNCYTRGPLARYVSALFEDDLGLVVALGSEGLFRFDRGTLRPYGTARDAELDGFYVYQALRSRDGTVWLATGKGLVHLAGRTLRVYTARDGLIDNNVRSVYEDQAGVLWLATAKAGIARLQGDRLLTLTMKDGLHDDRVYRLLDDRAGDLWMSSPRGIFRVRRQEIEDYAASRIPRLHPTDYDVADGLQTIECSIGAQTPGWRSRTGVLWFPTLHGVVSIDPARLRTNPVPPPVVIEEVVVDDRVMRPGRELVLPPGSQRIDFHFTALSLRVPERVRFRYMLEGFDAGWLEARGRRFASYTKVPPGPYRFRVIACNDDGLWNEAGAALSLRLRPRFRQTALFFWLVAGLVLLAAFGLYRLRVLELHSRYAAVLDERSRIAREMHDTFAQNLGGVALQLDSIKMQFRELPAELRQRLDETGRMIRYSLAEAYRAIRDLRSHTLDPPDLAVGLAQIVERATAGSEIAPHLSLDEPRPALEPTLEHHLLRIAQEAVTNAVRHSEARNLHVELRSGDGPVRLEIRDDGRGFDAEHAFSLQAGHYGLLGLRERADRMGARLTLDSRPGEGTRIVVELPTQR